MTTKQQIGHHFKQGNKRRGTGNISMILIIFRRLWKTNFTVKTKERKKQLEDRNKKENTQTKENKPKTEGKSKKRKEKIMTLEKKRYSK